jgi:hypothetical protein
LVSVATGLGAGLRGVSKDSAGTFGVSHEEGWGREKLGAPERKEEFRLALPAQVSAASQAFVRVDKWDEHSQRQRSYCISSNNAVEGDQSVVLGGEVVSRTHGNAD